MYTYDDETYSVVGSGPSRPESPVLEIEAGRAIEVAFRRLIQEKYLYQNQVVDLSQMEKAIQDSVKGAEAKSRESNIGGKSSADMPGNLTPERLKELYREVATRPWILGTRHVGDTDNERQITHYSRGAAALGASIWDMGLGFLLPSVQLQCLGCKAEKTFGGLVTSRGNPYSQPWGLVKSSETEQLFYPIFRCGGCSKFAYTMLIKRKGLKLQLCGITPRRPLAVSNKIPEALAPILRDAEQSVAEGDLFAAMYHLRTFIEHYVKQRLGVPMNEKRNGDDLIARYNATIIEGIKGTLPSLLTSWQVLSEALHSREGELEDYTKHRSDTCQHIEIITLLGEKALVQ